MLDALGKLFFCIIMWILSWLWPLILLILGCIVFSIIFTMILTIIVWWNSDDNDSPMNLPPLPNKFWGFKD